VRDHLRRLGEPAVAVISFAEPQVLRGWERHVHCGLPLYADPARAAYRAFGFGRGSFARVWLDPRVWARYARLGLRGARAPRQDTLQLGGDAVSDAEGIVRWVHHGRGPDDRPAVAQIAAVLDGLQDR